MRVRKKVVFSFAILLSLLAPDYSNASITGIREIITNAIVKTTTNIDTARLGISFKRDFIKNGRNASSFVDYTKDENGNFHLLSYGTGLIASESTLVDNIYYKPIDISKLSPYTLAAIKSLELPTDFRYFADTVTPYQRKVLTSQSVNALLDENLLLKEPFANINIMLSTVVKSKIGITYNLAIDLDKNCKSCKFYNTNNRALVNRSYSINKDGLISSIVQMPNKYAVSEYGENSIIAKYYLNFNYSLNPKFYPPSGKILSSDMLNSNDAYYQADISKKISDEIISMLNISSSLLSSEDNTLFINKLSDLLSLYDYPKIIITKVGESFEFSYSDSRLTGGLLLYCLNRPTLNDHLTLKLGSCST